MNGTSYVKDNGDIKSVNNFFKVNIENRNRPLNKMTVDSHYFLWIMSQKQFTQVMYSNSLSKQVICVIFTTTSLQYSHISAHFISFPNHLLASDILLRHQLFVRHIVLEDLCHCCSYYFVGRSLEAATKWLMDVGKICSCMHCRTHNFHMCVIIALI